MLNNSNLQKGYRDEFGIDMDANEMNSIGPSRSPPILDQSHSSVDISNQIKSNNTRSSKLIQSRTSLHGQPKESNELNASCSNNIGFGIDLDVKGNEISADILSLSFREQQRESNQRESCHISSCHSFPLDCEQMLYHINSSTDLKSSHHSSIIQERCQFSIPLIESKNNDIGNKNLESSVQLFTSVHSLNEIPLYHINVSLVLFSFSLIDVK